MARATCDKCCRPPARCICRYVVSLVNKVEIILLQHPKEVAHPKGSADLLLTSLAHKQLFIGENFDEHDAFQSLLQSTNKQLYVIFPGEKAVELTPQLLPELPPHCGGGQTRSLSDIALVIIDGTWKKAYKMFQLSKCLQQLPQLCLPSGINGQYDMRKTQKANALSTLEATCYALAAIEQSPDCYTALRESFAQYNQHQLSFRPKS
ncbi:DTW domain-containing protein [Thalassotalea euphylliae]|uniref:tRNA-uridine aminocarboxypropyltransferase n=1 Tax=Thalassotalea euphylliae TaxID=1655234 RepID=A0A3E0TRU4_9GAMM|nr:tRNA-uridine aminocarboxypropyltransferase [Thalassotalea euphylliae]REL26702.1 DTW domain-containing protein [Thalassotalea euphylliae]